MGSVAKRPNGKWRARYRDHRGKEFARHFDRKVDAQAWLDKVTASKIRGDYVDPKDSRTLFEDYAKEWMRTAHLGESSERMYNVYLRRHITPAMGGLTLGSIRRSDVQGFVTALSKQGLAPNTVKSIYGLVRMILESAVDDRRIPTSPCRRIVLPRPESTKMHIPTKEQVADLQALLPDNLRPLVSVLAGAGLRIGEALGLMVGDIDLDERTITIERQRSTKTGQIVKTKTASSNRVVPIGNIVTESLRPIVEDRPADDWLFVNSFGEPYKYAAWLDRIRILKLPYSTHDLRHFAASALISGGASVKQVQMFLGHSNATTTLNTYSHLWPGDDDRTRAVLDAALSGPVRLVEPLSGQDGTTGTLGCSGSLVGVLSVTDCGLSADC